MGDFQGCIDLMLAEEGGLALGVCDTSTRVGTEIAPQPVLPSSFNQLGKPLVVQPFKHGGNLPQRPGAAHRSDAA
ncbi:MAG TPA: hypothetical protein P5102_17810, partial [Candidatus Competibacteraceae bacterium]|nr:hypothetical protein [Candidatus Competibacteraceae bacterium]